MMIQFFMLLIVLFAIHFMTTTKLKEVAGADQSKVRKVLEGSFVLGIFVIQMIVLGLSVNCFL
jgi:hypothetical protein